MGGGWQRAEGVKGGRERSNRKREGWRETVDRHTERLRVKGVIDREREGDEGREMGDIQTEGGREGINRQRERERGE